MPHADASTTDSYAAFLAGRRCERALTRPWQIMTAAGAVAMLLFLHGILSSPFILRWRSFVNPYFGGLAIATAIAIYGLAARSTKRWLPAVIVVGLAPLGRRLLETVAEGRKLIYSALDWPFLGGLATMLVVAIYLLVRPRPLPPPTMEVS